MIGIDTSVLVRFLVQDDPDQARRATAAFGRLTAEDPGYLTTVVLAETFWVLTRAYRIDTDEVLMALEGVIATEEIAVQDLVHASAALGASRKGADFTDALIAAACASRGCSAVLSFDQRASHLLGFTSP